MIIIDNNHLPQGIFEELQDYCYQSEFQKVTMGDKDFLVLQPPQSILEMLQIEGYEMTLAFIRKAHSEFDTDWRIHADNKINGKETDLASVLYINKSEEVSENGTAFWQHHKYGQELPKDVTNKEFDRLLIEDSNDFSKWKQLYFVSSIPNRLVTYQANLFHSKFPNKIEHGERIVLVIFYSKTQ